MATSIAAPLWWKILPRKPCLVPHLSFYPAEVNMESAPVKLCGREFIRAVVFTCGGSRWRRHLTDYPEDILVQSHPYLPLDSRDASEKDAQEPERPSKGFIQYSPESNRDLQDKQQKFMHKRHVDVMRITASCCTIGCSEGSISALC
ncbi:insulin-like peptide INSL5 isoform X2 [Hemicordylus capensis]|nr:insulin-like peptide INSL5 isoform X2 [Hemicordylus capensis]